MTTSQETAARMALRRAGRRRTFLSEQQEILRGDSQHAAQIAHRAGIGVVEIATILGVSRQQVHRYLYGQS